MKSTYLLAGLLLWCISIAWSDWRQRRIPNALLGAAIACALMGLVFLGQTPFGASPSQCLLGAMAGLAVFLPLYIFRVMGAGDVKLFATAGALMGWSALLPIWLIASILAAVHALVWLSSRSFLPQLASFRVGGTLDRLPYGAHLAAGIAAVGMRPDLIHRFSLSTFW